MSIMMMATAATAAAAANEQQLAYGKYLAGECWACHSAVGKDKEGIPPIIGIEAEGLVSIMKAYKAGELENQAMINVARSKDDDELAALAAYLETLKPAEE